MLRNIDDLITNAGYKSLQEYTRAFPRDSWLALAERLDGDLPAVQLQAAVMREAVKKEGDIYQFAIQSLVRYLNEHLKTGWAGGEANDFESAWCFGDWSASLGDELKEFTGQVWVNLVQSHPPVGWLPKDDNDSYLESAFRKVLDSGR